MTDEESPRRERYVTVSSNSSTTVNIEPFGGPHPVGFAGHLLPLYRREKENAPRIDSVSNITREAVMQALFALVSGAYEFATASRRLRLWDNVAPCDMPALFQFEGAQDDSFYEEDLLLRRTLKARLFIYIDSKDESITGASMINDILDALDTAFAPSSFADQLTNRQTLGGLVSSARIIGPVLKDPGDLDGIGLIVAPVQIVLP